MELRQVQYFICLYEEGSVTRAARRLNIVQPALGMQIAKLEEALGQQLFEHQAGHAAHGGGTTDVSTVPAHHARLFACSRSGDVYRRHIARAFDRFLSPDPAGSFDLPSAPAIEPGHHRIHRHADNNTAEGTGTD